ncbi:hypothetical protein MPER_10055 [Moniliophthora perniciosa FA553]|nr:hypothetical protein MPER_10055 [Moniliophthora perniciosa FA553]
MDYPLTVYHMLVQCLEVTSPTEGTRSTRKSLLVHFVGAEKELNFVPIFSEIALLLPYHDIELVMFGPAVTTLLENAKKNPSSVAAKALSSPPRPIFEYTAPAECGSGSISIYLSTDSYWTKDNVPKHQKLDAIVACNAGMTSYSQWWDVVTASCEASVPFAVTDYWAPIKQRELIAQSYKDPSYAIFLNPIEANPFHRPGQNEMPTFIRIPNHSNGFTLVVTSEELMVKFAERNGVFDGSG